MAITLNHTIVPRRDKKAAATWVADLFDLEVGDTSQFSSPSRFAVVRVGATNLDFHEMQSFEPHHCAFLVDDEAFDRILAKIIRSQARRSCRGAGPPRRPATGDLGRAADGAGQGAAARPKAQPH